MPRDELLLGEMTEAANRATEIVERLDHDDPQADRDLLDALLWNYTVLGEAARALGKDVKQRIRRSRGPTRFDCATGSSTATGLSISMF